MATLSLLLLLCSSVTIVFAQEITPISTISPTSSTLNSVCIVSNTTAVPNASLLNSDAWAVGDFGVTIRWNGTRWSTINSSTQTNLYSIVLVNSSLGWAVGGDSNNGIILQWNGTWNVWDTNSPINQTLYGVTVNGNGSSGWAVGAGGATLYWDGSQWQEMDNMTMNNLRSVAMIHDGNDAWAVGDSGTILHFDGSNWSNMTSPTTDNLNAVVMVNVSIGWAVGGNGTDNGIILNMNGTTWNVWNSINFGGALNTTAGYVTDPINGTLYSLTMDTANSAWASGANGVVLYWTGTQWDGQANIAANSLRGISMVHVAPAGSNSAWAVGDGGKILAWTGTSWAPELPTIIVVPLLMVIIAVIVILGKLKLSKNQFLAHK